MQTFNYHTHTYRCNHADNVPDEAYVEGHLRAGFDRMAFTDHCPWAWFDARTDIPAKLRLRMRCDQKAEYLSSVNELKEKYKDIINIYSGFSTTFKILNSRHFELTQSPLKVHSRLGPFF